MKKIAALTTIALLFAVFSYAQPGHGSTGNVSQHSNQVQPAQYQNTQPVQNTNQSYQQSRPDYSAQTSLNHIQENSDNIDRNNQDANQPKGPRFRSGQKYYGSSYSDLHRMQEANERMYNNTSAAGCTENKNMKFLAVKNMIIYTVWIEDRWEWNSFYNCFAFAYGHMKFIIGCYSIEMGYWVRFEKNGKVRRRHIPSQTTSNCKAGEQPDCY